MAILISYTRKRKDTRSRRDRRSRLNMDWELQYPDLIDTYMAWNSGTEYGDGDDENCQAWTVLTIDTHGTAHVSPLGPALTGA